MNFVIPMAGEGKRFRDAGYATPKYLITVGGKTLLEWSLSSLPLELAVRIIFVGLGRHEDEYKVSRFIRNRLENHAEKLHFHWLYEKTRGQSETVLAVMGEVDHDLPLAVFNIDTYFHSLHLPSHLSRKDNISWLGSFYDNSSNYSYARVDENGFVGEVREKEPISRHALTGFYHFSRGELFFSAATDQIDNHRMDKGEYYIAPLYNDLIAQGHLCRLDICDEYAILGTPDEVESFSTRGVIRNRETDTC